MLPLTPGLSQHAALQRACSAALCPHTCPPCAFFGVADSEPKIPLVTTSHLWSLKSSTERSSHTRGNVAGNSQRRNFSSSGYDRGATGETSAPVVMTAGTIFAFILSHSRMSCMSNYPAIHLSPCSLNRLKQGLHLRREALMSGIRFTSNDSSVLVHFVSQF